MNRIVTVGLIAAALGTVPLSAAARGYRAYCNGRPYKQQIDIFVTTPQTLIQAGFAAPLGSARLSSYFAARDSWNGVVGMFDLVRRQAWAGGLEADHSNSRNDVVVVNDDSVLDGYLGFTTKRLEYCDSAETTPVFVEADVSVAMKRCVGPFWNQDCNDPVNFDDPTEETAARLSSGVGLGRRVMIHEIGHFLGLGHVQALNIMRGRSNLPNIGGNGPNTGVFGKDASYGRGLYPTGFPQVNLVASPQQATTSSIRDSPGRLGVQVYTAAQLPAQLDYVINYSNAGTSSVTHVVRLRMEHRIMNHNFDLAGPFVHTVAAGASDRIPTPGTVPAGIPTGTYDVVLRLDAGYGSPESNEADNIAIYNQTIVIQ